MTERQQTKTVKCPICKDEKIDYEDPFTPIYIHYDDGNVMKIQECGFCDLHGIVGDDGARFTSKEKSHS